MPLNFLAQQTRLRPAFVVCDAAREEVGFQQETFWDECNIKPIITNTVWEAPPPRGLKH